MSGWLRELPGLLRRFEAHWRTYLALHLAVTALTFLLLAPLTTALFRLAVLLSGDAALSDQDIVFFVLRPAGFAAFAVLASIVSIIVFLEHAALLTAAWRLQQGRAAPVSGILRFLALRGAALFGLALLILFRVLLWSLPFLLAAGLVYALLLTRYDINYYLAAKPPEWRLALALGGVIGLGWLALLLRLFTRWVFSLPMLLLGRRGPREALAASVAATRGRHGTILRAFLAWLLLMAGLALLASAFTAAAGLLFLHPGVQSIRGLVLGLAVTSGLGVVASVAVSLLGSALLSLLILDLFRRFGPAPGVVAEHAGDAFRPLGRRWARRVAAAALVVLLVVAAGAVHALLDPLRFAGGTEVMAHRGASAAAPENTLAAVQAAIDAGADWVEIDVQETADGEIVVVHDSDLKKIAGVPLVVGRSTLAELRAVDVGSWFGGAFDDQRIPTLREVLALCRDRIRVNIELKYYGTERRLEEGVADIVDEFGMADRVVAMSLSLPGIRRMRAVRPGWTLGLLSTVALGDLAGLDVDFLALNARTATRHLIRRLQARGKAVMVWTVNDAVGVSTMASRGADVIITDEPALAVGLLEQRRRLEPAERLLLNLAELFDRPSLLREQ